MILKEISSAIGQFFPGWFTSVKMNESSEVSEPVFSQNHFPLTVNVI